MEEYCNMCCDILEGPNMKIKREKVYNELFKGLCKGNCNRFAREMSVDPAHLYRFLTAGTGGGRKIIGGVVKFCMKNGLDFKEYIEI